MYDYLRQSYSAGKDYLKAKNPKGVTVLKREDAEDWDEFEGRMDRCPVRNHIGIIIDRFHSAAVNVNVERDENWDELWKDYEPVFQDALKEAQIVGSSYIVATMNRSETMNEMDLVVFVVPEDAVVKYLPGQMLAFKECETTDDGEKEFKVVYRTDGTWVKLNDANEEVDRGDSGFGELPVVEMNPSFPGYSQVGMLAPIQESLVNLLSLHNEESQQQTFTRHLISGLSDIPKTREEEKRVQKMISGKRLLLFKDSVSVNTMAADVGQAQNLLEAIKQTEEMLYAVAGLKLAEPVQLSGIAKKIELEQFADIRNKLVSALESAEIQFLQLLGRALGINWDLPSYSRQVINQTWPERIAELKELLALGLSEDFYQKVKSQFENDYLL